MASALERSETESEFTAYHMKCINRFRWTALARSVIYKNGFEGYSVKASPPLCQLVFYIYFVNTVAKLVFLLFLVTDHLQPIEFLDRICGVDYLLCGLMVCISYIIWQRYPLYEIIHRLWEIENRIYRRLGSPREIKWNAEEKHSVTIWAHLLLCGIGCCSLTIQFYEAPKYCVFTYSLIETDTSILRIIFCFHEALFLSHAWAAMSTSNGVCSLTAVDLSLLINEMSKALDELAKHQTVSDLGFSSRNADIVTYHDGHGDGSNGNIRGKRDEMEDGSRTTAFLYSNSNEGVSSAKARETNDSGRRRLRRFQNSRTSSFGSAIPKGYTFKMILYDYQQLMLASEMFNAWVGYKIVGLSICGFCQYISSTTMAFQVLRMPGTGIGDIWFYIQDCTVAVYVTFRVFDYMSFVLPASEEFMNSVRKYVALKGIVSGHIRKFQKTLKPVSLKLGPSPWKREAVLETMEMLASYYVCVALW